MSVTVYYWHGLAIGAAVGFAVGVWLPVAVRAWINAGSTPAHSPRFGNDGRRFDSVQDSGEHKGAAGPADSVDGESVHRGTLTPAPFMLACCPAVHRRTGYCCTRKPHHDGWHVAYGIGNPRALYRWTTPSPARPATIKELTEAR